MIEGITAGLLKAFGYLFISGVVYAAYTLTHDYATRTPNIKLMILKGVLGIIVIAFLVSSTLGTHTEGCSGDGDCQTVFDFKPTQTEYVNSFTFVFLLFTVPFLLGAYDGYKQNKPQ